MSPIYIIKGEGQRAWIVSLSHSFDVTILTVMSHMPFVPHGFDATLGFPGEGPRNVRKRDQVRQENAQSLYDAAMNKPTSWSDSHS